MLFNRQVVKVVIRAKDTGRFFIIRSTIPIMPGWSLVGGGMTPKESEFDALLREIKEELRVGADAFSSIKKRNGTHASHHSFFCIPIHMKTHVFEALVQKEADFKPRPNWEVAESKWVSESEIASLLGDHYLHLFSYNS